METRRVGIRALQQNAAAVVASAEGGEIVEITDRGRPVAQMTPVPRDRLSGLLDAGLGRRRRRELDASDKPLRGQTGPSLGDLLADARREER